MVANLYGVDIKITPEGKAVPIEINGIESGTDFFKTEEGPAYYRRFAITLEQMTGGRPIFFKANHYRPLSGLERAMNERWTDEDRQTNRKAAAYFEQLHSTIKPEIAWIDDQHAFDLARLDKEPEHEEWHYAFHANKAGVEAYLYKKLEIGRRTLRFTLSDGRSITIRPEEIGAIRASPDWKKTPKELLPLFMNTQAKGRPTPLLEGVQDSKILLYWLCELVEESDGWSFPKTITYGLGGTTPAQLRAFVRATDADHFVRKYGKSQCGIGVDIIPRWKLLRERGKGSDSSSIELHKGMIKLFAAVLEGYDTDAFLSVYQPFIKSIPLPHPKTREPHDGCARVIVLAPPGGDPVAIGGQWRLAQRPLASRGRRLEERLRANLSRGATPVPMGEPEETLAARTAKVVVSDYESIVLGAADGVDLFKKNYAMPSLESTTALRAMFLLTYLNDLTERHGFSTLPSTTLSRKQHPRRS